MSDKELYSGMIRLHILYHASKGPIFGLWIIEELGRHGYKLSPGTLYPILHALERKGYLRSTEKRDGRQLVSGDPGWSEGACGRQDKSSRVVWRIVRR